jgi:hypothetical protein
MKDTRPLRVRETLVFRFINLLRFKWTREEYEVRDQKSDEVSDEKLKKVSRR